ncbi:MAG: hypothetical protein M1822_003769 [Bathelium mastoideum]|nr:MAG: hypothetical protein M1822_003769 [Bathelium mastoideum]
MSDTVSVSVQLKALSPYEPIIFRTLTVTSGAPVSVGRASSSESKGLVAAPNNAYLDCPVVSRKHAELSVSPNKKDPRGLSLWITDVGSMHGTYLNDRRLNKGLEERVDDKDLLRFGCEVQRDEECYRPLTYAVKLDMVPSHQTSQPDKDVNLESRSFEVPDSTSDEYDSHELDDSDSDRSSSPIVPPLPEPTYQTSTSALPKISTVFMDKITDTDVEKPSESAPKDSQGHEECDISDIYGCSSNSEEDDDHYQSQDLSVSCASPVTSAVSVDDLYSCVGQSPGVDTDEAVEDEHADDEYEPRLSAEPRVTDSNSFGPEKKQEPNMASRDQAFANKARPFGDIPAHGTPSYPIGSTYGSGNLPGFWAPPFNSNGPRYPQMPPIYPAAAPPLRLPAYPKLQADVGMNPYAPNNAFPGSAPFPPNGGYYNRGSRSGEMFDQANGGAPLNPSEPGPMFGLDSNASFSTSPYQANRFDPNAYPSHFTKQPKVIPSSRFYFRGNLPQTCDGPQVAKEDKEIPEPAENSTKEEPGQLNENQEHSDGNSQQKSALRISDLVHSLCTKDNWTASTFGGKKRRFSACADALNPPEGSVASPADSLQPLDTAKPSEHHVDSAHGELDAYSESLPDEFDEDVYNAKENDDFEGADDFEGSLHTDNVDTAESMALLLTAATAGSQRSREVQSYEQQLDRVQSKATQADGPVQPAARNEEGPPKKKVKTDTASAGNITEAAPTKSKIMAAASAVMWAALGSVATLTALAKLPESFFQ